MALAVIITALLSLAAVSDAAPYAEHEAQWNINLNRTATNPLDYYSAWPGHVYHPSPTNWRFPFYSMFLDRWSDGDPTNNESNSTVWEFDIHETQFRAGGDVVGLKSSLDYLQSMGIKGIYIIGTVYQNLPWEFDQYSAGDFTLLDKHAGTIAQWRDTIDEIHRRGMYVLLDMTVATMSDFIGFVSLTNSTRYLNGSTPFDTRGYRAIYKNVLRQDQGYLDFSISDTTTDCVGKPDFYTEDGSIDTSATPITCFTGDFDQYGDVEAFGDHPQWQRQLAKFASVQDRLQDWKPSVSKKLRHFGCLMIDALDPDGFRIDKATQMTAGFLGDWADSMRQCARARGKNNFFIPGEITGGNQFSATFLGRGRTPKMYPKDVATALSTVKTPGGYIRPLQKSALDSTAWSYAFYRWFEHFLGIAGNISTAYDIDYYSLTNAINEVFRTNDMVNANTGKIDLRHMYGMTNHDLFRWPSIVDGRLKNYLGMAMTTLLIPGIPLALYGEEQDFHLLDNTANNYIFGRQPMMSSVAWQHHGCYNLGSVQYTSNVSFAPASRACHDDETSRDSFNPVAPARNVMKQMHYLRTLYPTLNDAYTVQVNGNYSLQNVTLINNQTWLHGLWSTMRRPDFFTQDFGTAEANQTIWFLYSNKPWKQNFNSWKCSQPRVKWNPPYPNLLGPFPEGTTIRNLLYPYEQRILSSSKVSFYNNAKAPYFGCLDSIEMEPYSMKVFVDAKYWKPPMPTVVAVTPFHDQRILSSGDSAQTVPFSMQFSEAMDCGSIAKQLSISSSTFSNQQATFSALNCGPVVASPAYEPLWAAPRAVWQIQGQIQNVYDGIHWVDLKGPYVGLQTKVASYAGSERFLFRIGKVDNPLVFPQTANYSSSLLDKVDKDTVTLKHNAAGASKFRYTTNWKSTWSPWTDLTQQKTTVPKLPWKGMHTQKWTGTHVICEYWANGVFSAHSYQHSDSENRQQRWPHLHAQGPFNSYLYDTSLNSKFKYLNSTSDKNYTWAWDLMTEWPANISLNVWGINPGEEPDKQYIYGDLDRDYVLDRVPPTLSQTDNVMTFNHSPPAPYLSYHLQINDITRKWWYVPQGRRWVQVIIYLWLTFVPLTLGLLAMFLYAGVFNRVNWNKFGVKNTESRGWFKMRNLESNVAYAEGAGSSALAAHALAGAKRRKILIATLEYDISDLGIKIKIGGLGSMAQLMGTNLKHQDLIWVVPMVGDVDYPIHVLKRGEPFEVEVHGSTYGIDVFYHVLENITYILLSSPIFSKQTKADPYPPRMDDLESAVFYSAWNQCIAKTCTRFPIDLYHINDYHGALAPIYLLPKVIPVALSLHNAEFQGLWPLRKADEKKEVCSLFNIMEEMCSKYVQFGNVFNLLHAGVSFLRLHQQGFGAVGVSEKYGARSLARYPIFWSLKEIGKLPNPDPTDLGEVKEGENSSSVQIDWEAEGKRKDLKREAQEWANLIVDPTAQLLVFVGRWTVQKGIDLIADLAPTLLEDFNVQMIIIGPPVDLHGRFAAEKLGVMMELYPGRVCSKPAFTACPPCVFSGADFALIPSRDEPFGLVAVEFGRKGALGIGCKTGGLGNMPGWWYTMNSASAYHLLSQFESACRSALKSSEKTRALLRARAAKQRFPVAVWVKRLNSLQSRCIYLSHKINKGRRLNAPNMEPVMDDHDANVDLTPQGYLEPLTMETFQRKPSVLRKHAYVENTPEPRNVGGTNLQRRMSLGSRKGPGRHQELAALQEEEQYYEAQSTDSYSSGSDEAFYQREDSFEGHAPEERDFDQYMGHWDRSDGSESQSGMSVGMGQNLQRDDGRPGWPPRMGGSDSRPSSAGQIYPPDQYGDDRHLSYSRYDYPRNSLAHFRMDSAQFDDDSSMDDPGLTRQGSFLDTNINSPYLQNSATESSRLSVLSLTDLEKDNAVQQSTIKKGEKMFTDGDNSAKKAFVEALRKGVTPATSKRKLCIETFLTQAEKNYFLRKKAHQIHGNKRMSVIDAVPVDDDFDPTDRIRGMRRIMAMKLGWPVYTIMMVIGQVLAANSYQLTLLAGTYNTTLQTYTINTIYAGMSIVWWITFRRLPSCYVLSLPFVLYSIAFTMVGLPHISRLHSPLMARNLTVSASYLYSAASASGSLFFALNFGAEGGIEVKGWVVRACIVQGLQQVWSAAMWYWGNALNDKTSDVSLLYSNGVPAAVAGIVWAIAIFLFIIFVFMFFGMPKYYQQAPGSIPAFYRSMYRRKIIVWFLVSQIISNFWLALPYGRSWTYLWESNHLATWVVAFMCFFFFIVLWVIILVIIRQIAVTHTWAPVIFALGVIAPRYFAEFWAVSTIGMYLPWAGGPFASALLGRCLWLWLTLLDNVQGAGLGIMLLQTLIRDHVSFTLICAQVLGAISTIAAKSINLPFSSYLVNFSNWDPSQGAGPFGQPMFWLCLSMQVSVPIGFFFLFRKAQLAF